MNRIGFWVACKDLGDAFLNGHWRTARARSSRSHVDERQGIEHRLWRRIDSGELVGKPASLGFEHGA
jgi:hypothetical protein